ncbi:MAG: hypothetical protein B6245_13050 [Desulfobacteraceae bacterium 4572_88]|nr:MAG: hypothetical protein B6245_13050 [Desulfobacteraceae bacterium 4572_88]
MNDDTITEPERDIILLFDMDGNISHVNATGMERIGYFEDLLDMNIADILSPDQLEKIRKSLLDDRSIPGREAIHQAELIDSNLGMIAAEIRASLIMKGGQPSEILLIASDQDAPGGGKAQAPAQGSEAGERYHRITEAVKEMLLTFDMNGRLTYVNGKGREMMGYFGDEPLDMNISDLLSPEQIQLLKKQLLTQPISGKRKVVIPEAPFMNRELNLIPLEVTASLIIRDKTLSEIVILARNLSRRKQSSDDARPLQSNIPSQQDNKYQLIAEAIKELILTFDMAGNITYVNGKGTEMMGYFEDELLDMNIADILPPDQLEALKQNMLRSPINQNRKLVIPEVLFTDRELRPIPMEVTASLIVKGGKPSDILILARDLTRRKRMEKELQRSSR